MPQASAAGNAAAAVVKVDRLCKTYGEGAGVREISFEVRRGEIFGIIGPNGAGKTTTAECACGMRIPDSGGIDVLGLDPQADRVAIREYVGVQLQESVLPLAHEAALPEHCVARAADAHCDRMAGGKMPNCPPAQIHAIELSTFE